VIARCRGPTRRDHYSLGAVITLLVALIVAATTRTAFLVGLPLASTATIVAVRSPSPRYLRTIGVVLVVASLVGGALAILSN